MESKTREKSKKITVKFFLNKALQPIEEDNEKRYPLYMLITYNRKNTMMKSHYGTYYKDMKEIERVGYPGLLEFEERTLQKTIRYEVSKVGEQFDMKGLSRKYEVYCKGIHVVLSHYFKNILWMAVLRSEAAEYGKALNFSDPEVRFETLYYIAKKIYSNIEEFLSRDFNDEFEVYYTFNKLYHGSFFSYSFPTIIEWLDKSAIEDYKLKLLPLYKAEIQTVEKNISLINRIVLSSVKV